MLSKIGVTEGLNINQFKDRLRKIWDKMDYDILRAACKSFFKRLRETNGEKGERFELTN